MCLSLFENCVMQFFTDTIAEYLSHSTKKTIEAKREDEKAGRRHKLYIFEIINSGCHLSYNFLHFEINLHLSYIIVNSGCYMLYNSIFSKINIHLLYQQIQNSIRFQSLDRFVDGD